MEWEEDLTIAILSQQKASSTGMPSERNTSGYLYGKAALPGQVGFSTSLSGVVEYKRLLAEPERHHGAQAPDY